jgi:hypothetical protein
MKETLQYYVKYQKDICLVVGFLSQEGQALISAIPNIRVDFNFGEIMMSPSVIIQNGLIRLKSKLTVDDVLNVLTESKILERNNHWYYFDHKWPDSLSFIVSNPHRYMSEFSQVYNGFGCQKKPEGKLALPFPYFSDPPYRGLCKA